MTTLVSAFLWNVNSRTDRSLKIYHELGLKILRSKVPKIIFVDSIMYSLIHNKKSEDTIIIKYDFNESWLSKYRTLPLKITTDNPNKDTLDYILTICNKTEFVRKAIQINHFKTDNFVWVDFGIAHLFKNNDELFDKSLIQLTKKYDNIRIARIWDLNVDYGRDIYKNICWYFAGGIFGGSSDKLIIFADKFKEKCEQIIKETGSLMWEVNVWYLVYLENKELFDPYISDHNNSIIVNY